MAQLPNQRQRWTPPAARLEGDRILKARAAQQRVRDAAVQAEAEAKVALAQEEKVLGEKVDDLEKTVETLIKDIPKIMPAAGGGRRTVKKILEKYYDLPNGLGSAAGNDTEDFATAAQGTKADSAVQPGDLATVAYSGSQDNMADGTTNKNYTAIEQTKLAGIEAGADVTDATNVDAAGAVMNTDTTTAAMGFVLDEDDFTSNSATKLPSQQSVAANIGRRAPKARFKTPSDLLQDTTDIGYSAKIFTVTTGDEIVAGDHRYLVAASGASDHHTVTKGGVKLYVQIGRDGSFHAGAFGMVADNTSTLLSSIYSTIGDAQAAYPLCALNGYLDTLALERDGVAMQEAIYRGEATTNAPAVRCGLGICRSTKEIKLSGLNKGFVLAGPTDTSAHQGSTPAGFTIDYRGTAKTEAVAAADVDVAADTFLVALNTTKFVTGRPVRLSTTGKLPAPLIAGETYFIRVVDGTHVQICMTPEQAGRTVPLPINLLTQGSGTHTLTLLESIVRGDGSFFQLHNIGFWNHGDAANAIHFCGSSNLNGSGRAHLKNISIVEATGTNPYSEAAIKYQNGIDYTWLDGLEYTGTSPITILVDGGAMPNGGTTRVTWNNLVMSQVGNVFHVGIKLRNGNMEHPGASRMTYNNFSTSAGCTVIDTTEIDACGDGRMIKTWRGSQIELDSTGTATSKLIGNLTKVKTAEFEDSYWADGTGQTTRYFELRESLIHIHDCAIRAAPAGIIRRSPAVTEVVAASAVDATANTFTVASNVSKFRSPSPVGTGTNQAVKLSTDGTLPAGLTAGTNYWIARLDDVTIYICSSLANALAGIPVDISDQGTGNHTITILPVDTTSDFRVGGNNYLDLSNWVSTDWGSGAIILAQSGGVVIDGTNTNTSRMDTYELLITATGSVTLSTRLHSSGSPRMQMQPGQKFIFRVKNALATGSWAGLTFPANFKQSGWAAPANGNRKSAMFEWDSAAEVAIQITPWTPDIPN